MFDSPIVISAIVAGIFGFIYKGIEIWSDLHKKNSESKEKAIENAWAQAEAAKRSEMEMFEDLKEAQAKLIEEHQKWWESYEKTIDYQERRSGDRRKANRGNKGNERRTNIEE